MLSNKPTIVIVPGSFSAYGAYDPLLKIIRDKGFSALAIQLPSTQKRHPLPPATLQDDASHVRGVVERLIAEEEGREIVVVGHSYGGSVITEALSGLGLEEGEGGDREEKRKGGVKRIVFLSATVPKVGETQISAMMLVPGMLPEEVEGYMHMDPVFMAPIVCSDLPYAQAYENALKLPHHSAVAFKSVVTQASYKEIPVTYIYCEKDLVIVPETQQRFIDTIEEVSGRKVDVRKIDAGHCPNWSKPEELLDLILEAAEM